MGRLLIIIVELLLVAGAVFSVVTGKIDGLIQGYPWAVYGVELITLGIGLVAAYKSPQSTGSLRIALSISAVALITVNGAIPPGTIGLTSSLQHFYFAIVIFCAAAAKWPSMVTVLVIIVGAETGAVIVEQGSQAVQTFPRFLAPVGLLIGTGFLVFLTTRAFVPGNAPMVSAPSKPLAPKPEPSSPVDCDSKILLKTQEFTAEQLGRSPAGVDEILSSVVYFMSRNFDAYSALGFIYNAKQRAFILNSYQTKSMHVIKNCTIPVGKGLVGKIAVEKRSFMSGDISAYGGETIYYDNPSEIINSILAVPIISEDKELLGALVVDSKNKRVFSENHKEVLRRFSGLSAALITNARMRIAQQETARQFQTFYETSQQFTTALAVDRVFDILFQTVLNLTRGACVMAVTFEPRRKTGRVYKLSGPKPSVQQGYEFPINAGLYSYAYQKRSVVHISDWTTQAKDYYRFVPEEQAVPSIRSLIILPILDDEQRCLGVLSVEGPLPGQFVGKIEQLLSTLAGNASVAITRAMLYQKMERLATTDGLTGLNNHRTFQDHLSSELERSRRYNRTFALILMDIDHFKSFNDTYGHQTGDLVLREIAACIRKSLRQTDVPARYGGEEFAVILPENTKEGARITAERIRHTIESHVVQSDSGPLKVTVSLGCAVYPETTTEKSELIECADKALYYSKEHGRNQVTVYSKGM